MDGCPSLHTASQMSTNLLQVNEIQVMSREGPDGQFLLAHRIPLGQATSAAVVEGDAIFTKTAFPLMPTEPPEFCIDRLVVNPTPGPSPFNASPISSVLKSIPCPSHLHSHHRGRNWVASFALWSKSTPYLMHQVGSAPMHPTVTNATLTSQVMP